jgi:selenocysteine-specific elongation factor
MTIVIGTAGHIDHGKSTLLRALTGIDPDRLPEERRRGMTIDVGYAHLDLGDGTSIDFVDVPGHDALIGNMLVGAGEIDAALLTVAADDGPRAQTLEHLELLDALGLRDGLAVVTKIDLVDPDRAAAVAAEVAALLARTSLAGSFVLRASATTGEGIDDVRDGVLRLRDGVAARAVARPPGPLRMAVDRAFAVRGRGTVVTGSLRGGSVRTGAVLRLEPGGAAVRVRGMEVHHAAVEMASGGRTALNVTGAGLEVIERGLVLTSGPGVEATDRLLVALAPPAHLAAIGSSHRRAAGDGRRAGHVPAATGPPSRPPSDGAPARLHIGTAQVDAVVGRRGREGVSLPDGSVAAILRLSQPVATFLGDRGVLRRPSPGDVVAAVRVLDPGPPRGAARRRVDAERLASLSVAIADADADAAADALVALHGAVAPDRVAAAVATLARPVDRAPADVARGLVLAPDVRAAIEDLAVERIRAHHGDRPLEPGLPLAVLRPELVAALRRRAGLRRDQASAAEDAVGQVIDGLEARRRIARDGDRLRDPARGPGHPPELTAAMDRLVALLDVPAPPALAAAARAAGCPADGVRSLLSEGRIVRVEADLAWSAPTFQRLAAQALALARRGPLTPAALRDVLGTSRRYVVPLIEDLDRRGILARTATGHVPGPKAPR